MKKLLLFLLLGCDGSYTVEKCQELLFKKYKGQPNASHQFDKNCDETKLVYKYTTCQKALEKLIQHGNLTLLKEQFGDDILNCFTENDLQKFSKKG